PSTNRLSQRLAHSFQAGHDDLVVVERFLDGHSRYQLPWRTLTDEEGDALVKAAIYQMDTPDEYLLRVVLQAYKDGDEAFAGLVDTVVAAVQEELPGAAGALHETRAQLGKPGLAQLPVERIADSSDIKLIVVCLIAFGDEEIREQASVLKDLLSRPEVPVRVRDRLQEILNDDG
ncbi:MAG: hypothetical protein WD294_09205, partial [Phycisphaeraceae bacterium]